MSKKTDKVEQDLQRREKAELIALIKLMLQQQPELAWVLQTPLPTTGKSTLSTNASLYRSQIEQAVTAATEHYQDRSYREALKTLWPRYKIPLTPSPAAKTMPPHSRSMKFSLQQRSGISLWWKPAI